MQRLRNVGPLCHPVKEHGGQPWAFYVPVPARFTFCGLPPPLSLTETDADRLPLAEGVKVTVIKQLAPAATLEPQVVVRPKSLPFVPVIEMLVMLTDTLPLLLSVIFLPRLLVPTGWLPKFRLEGVSCT